MFPRKKGRFKVWIQALRIGHRADVSLPHSQMVARTLVKSRNPSHTITQIAITRALNVQRIFNQKKRKQASELITNHMKLITERNQDNEWNKKFQASRKRLFALLGQKWPRVFRVFDETNLHWTREWKKLQASKN